MKATELERLARALLDGAVPPGAEIVKRSPVRIAAICEEGEPVPAGMTPDLTRMNFTALGDWEEYLDQSVKAASQPRVPITNGDDIDNRRRRGQKNDRRPPPRTAPAQSRAAITITIAP